MLVLSRCEGEAIFIGEDVVVRIGEITRGKVRLVIQAPVTVKVDREEVRGRTKLPAPDPVEVELSGVSDLSEDWKLIERYQEKQKSP